MAESDIRTQFPEQFEGGPYFLGISIDAGWQKIVVEACREIHAALMPAELAKFHWRQIKEKFGGLQMYWGPSNRIPMSVQSQEGVALIELDGGQAEDGFSEPTQRKIRDIIDRAQKQAGRTCEICGAEGRLYPDGCWQTLCDTHAASQERVFPRVYGELIECRTHKMEFGGRQAVLTHGLFFRNRGAAVWHWMDDEAQRKFVLVDELPDDLFDLFAEVRKHRFEIVGIEPFETSAMAIWVDDLLGFVGQTLKARKETAVSRKLRSLITMPAGVRVDARSQLERDLDWKFDGTFKVIARTEEVRFPAIALVAQQEKGTRMIFTVKDREEVDDPKAILMDRLLELDRLRGEAEAMLARLAA